MISFLILALHVTCMCLFGSLVVIGRVLPGVTVVSNFPFHFWITMV